jgi:uncharacterized protein (DUF924 family)
MTAKNPKAQEVLDYWKSIGPKGWWRRDEAVDAEIRRRFGETHKLAAAGKLDDWRQDPESCLALVIVLDQFSRNMFRADARAFAADKLAREVGDHALHQGFDDRTEPDLRSFFFMPFMHSEEIADQDRCVRLFHAEGGGGDALKYAILHRDIIRRFGRFPHRNAALGRAPTAAETAFLAAGGFAA